jgi:protein-disulfide isomerase
VVPNEGAKVLVVKFNDYQCPPCRQSYMDYKSVFAKYEASHPGQVKFVLKDFPLESECNASVTTSLHPAACEAAVAGRLAREQNRLEPFEEWIFANQTATPDAVKRAARDIGQVTSFDARYQSVLEQTKADIAYGRTLGVRSTPTFFINGVKIEGALPAIYFDQAIAYELARAK